MTRRVGIAACVLALLLPMSLRAGTVKRSLSDHVSWVGSPIKLDFIFDNVQSHEPPVVPSVPGLQVTSSGTPSRSSSISIINGHRTEQSTLTYRFLIDATQPGTYELPKFGLTADGRVYDTTPVELTFRSANDPALIRAQITGVPAAAWIGDTLPATLRILVRPFKDHQLSEGSMSAASMWRQIDFATSRWGPFHDTIVQLLEANTFPSMTIVNLDVQGVAERWYAFDITSNIQLLNEGELDLSDVLVRMNYPMQIGRTSGSLFDPLPRLGIASTRPVTASPGLSQVIVKTPPLEGRPTTWAGAVGQFRFDVSASPTDVVVGEPITLTMRITDVGSGPKDLELLQAPNLDGDESLTASFRVPDDRPGGVVSGPTKTFTQSIRPTSAEVEFIPPVPFAYFDPVTQKYDVALSRPIDITVTTSMQLDAASMGGTASPQQSSTDGVTTVRGGLLANYTDPEVLLRPRQQPSAGWLAGIAIAPPLAVGLLTGVRSRRASDKRNPNRQRFRTARRRFDERLSSCDGHPDAAAQAIRAFVADRLGLPADAITSREAASAVQSAGHPKLADNLLSRLDELERLGYAGDTGAQEMPLHSIRDLIRQLETSLR